MDAGHATLVRRCPPGPESRGFPRGPGEIGKFLSAGTRARIGPAAAMHAPPALAGSDERLPQAQPPLPPLPRDQLRAAVAARRLRSTAARAVVRTCCGLSIDPGRGARRGTANRETEPSLSLVAVWFIDSAARQPCSCGPDGARGMQPVDCIRETRYRRHDSQARFRAGLTQQKTIKGDLTRY